MRYYLALGAITVAVAAAWACSDDPKPGVTSDAGTDQATQDVNVQDGEVIIPPSGTADINFISLSDFHGQLDPISEGSPAVKYGGLGLLSTYLKKERQTNPNTVLTTQGDEIGATPVLSSLFEDKPTVAGMNFLGLQVNTLGNHNFDFGIPHLKARMAEAKYTYVSTNLTNVDKELDFKAPEDSGNRKLRYHMIEVGQASPKPKVAFIGITNRDAPTLIFPGKMGTVTVKEPIAAANDAIKEARRKGAAVVIVLAHLGMTNKDAQGNPTGPLMELAKGLDGADVVFGDHTDVSANTKVGDAVVIESKSRGRTYSKVVVKVVDGKVMSKEASLVDPKETPEMQADPEAETVLKPYRDLLQATQDVKIGTLSNKLERGCTGAGCKPVERIGEIPLGDLVADALLDKYKTDFGAQVVLMNGGGLRQPLPSSFTSTQPNRTNPPFDIVIGDVFSVLPFTNFTVIRKVTGQLLWQIAEHGVADMPNAHGKFPQIAGWRFEWSQTGAAGARVRKVALTTGTACTPGGEAGTDAGSGCAAGQTCNATTSTCEKDIPSNDATEYTIVTNDFLNTGGDNYVMLKEAEPTPPRDELAAVVRDYIKARGTLTYPAHAAYVPMRIIPLP